jgi:hypothetical protein
MQTLNLNEQEMVAGGYRPFLGKIAIDPETIRRTIALTIRGPGMVNFNVGSSLGSLVGNFQSPGPAMHGPGGFYDC